MKHHDLLTRFLLSITLLVLLASLDLESAKAQRFEKKWLNVGEFQSYYSSGGIEPRRNPREGEQWPAFDPNADHFVRKALWVRTKNWTDEEGNQWTNKIAHVGPRTQGENEVFPMEFELRAKFPEPAITVDGLQSFHKPVFNQSIDQIDPNMKADRMIYNRINTLNGIQIERRVRAFSQEHHDQYHVWEYVFTNTGNIDGDEEIEKPDQTLEGVLFGFRSKYTINLGAGQYLAGPVTWGRNTITDIVRGELDDYEPDFRGFFSWHGRIPSEERFNNLGAPVWSDASGVIQEGDSVGRLGAAEFIGQATLHADKSPKDRLDDPSQPTEMFVYDSGLMNVNDGFDENVMQEEVQFMVGDHMGGFEDPSHAEVVVPDKPEYGGSWIKRFADQKENAYLGENGGWMPGVTYGPYTLEPGESVRVVFVEGVAGLRRPAAWSIGKAYKRSGADDSNIIAFDANGNGTIEPDEKRTKNEWVMTGRDSLFKIWELAEANFDAEYEIPEAPRPPQSFTVTSGVDQISLEWEPMEGGPMRKGWQIYRSHDHFSGAVEDSMQYQLIAELDGNATSYKDANVQRGLQYYYYIQAVGEVNNDPSGDTPTGEALKSNRYYTQTYNPASLKREPGQALSDVHVVPNPYNLASDRSIRWPSKRDRLGFLDVPGRSTIRIYTERGDLVKTISHTDGSGDQFWDLKTESEQTIVSGVYIAVITDEDTGNQVVRKFIVVR